MAVAIGATLFYSFTVLAFLYYPFYYHIISGSYLTSLLLFCFGAAVLVQTIRFVRSARRVHKMPPLLFYYGEVAAVISAAFITSLLARGLSLSPVIASSLVGIAGSFFIPGYAFSIFCGSFVGMTGPWILSYPEIIGASLLAGLIFVYGRYGFNGMGGKLGVTAFAGVWIIAALFTEVEIVETAVVVSRNAWSSGVLILLCGAAAYLTHWIHENKKVHVVASAGIVAVLSVVSLQILNIAHSDLLSAALYSAAFAGMCNSQRLKNGGSFWLAGFACGLLFILTEPAFYLFGGKLGTIAFVAALTSKFVGEWLDPHEQDFFCTE